MRLKEKNLNLKMDARRSGSHPMKNAACTPYLRRQESLTDQAKKVAETPKVI
jgi:hypothetical protein